MTQSLDARRTGIAAYGLDDPVPGQLVTDERKSDGHRLRVVIEDGSAYIKLVHPEGGCPTPSHCSECGRAYEDQEASHCYACEKGPDDECWLTGWADELAMDELLHGTVSFEVPLAAEHDGESAIFYVGNQVTT